MQAMPAAFYDLPILLGLDHQDSDRAIVRSHIAIAPTRSIQGFINPYA
jgi:hypothetical protein